MSKESHRDTLRKETRWERRDRKHKKRRYGMRVDGRSVKAVLLRLIGKRASIKDPEGKEAEETEKEAKQDRSRQRE